jgi:SAM-dependent methyltransferase
VTKPWEVPYAERFAGRKPRVCLGVVAFGDIAPETFESAVFWAFHNGRRYSDRFEVMFAMATKREQYRARNALVQEAMQQRADFLLMVDDDHTLMDAPDMIADFFKAEKPVQGGLYVQRRNDKIQPVLQHYDRERGTCRWYGMHELPKESGPVDILGGGINWIDMTVFDFLADSFWWPYPQDERKVWFKPHPKYGLDLHFSIKVKEELGIQPWLNLDVKVGHVSHERAVIRPPGMPGLNLCDACDGLSSWDGETWVCHTCESRNGAPHRLKESDFAHREKYRAGYPELADAICLAADFITVLDVGAGQGFLVDEMVKRSKVVKGVEREEAARAFMSPNAKERIVIGDATNGSCPGGKFDMVTCVEVAEHIEPEKTEGLLDNVTSRSAKWLFFTADDTPSRLHINLHPLSWWQEQIEGRGFRFDDQKTGAIRGALKDNPCPWLGKNAMLFERVTNA